MNTNTFDVGWALLIWIVLGPCCIGFGGLSSVVSERLLGESEDAERICIAVPVLFTVTFTADRTTGLGRCRISPTPLLNAGKGSRSLYVSVVHTVVVFPSTASDACVGLSGSWPPGEKTVTLSGF